LTNLLLQFARKSRAASSAGLCILQKIPLLVRAQLATICLAFIAAISVGTLAGDGGVDRMAFATPAITSAKASRSEETSELANRISIAFDVDPQIASEFSNWILEASERHRLSTELIASLVFTESSFRKHVVSGVGAIGPAQVRPDYWGAFCGTSDLSDPAENIYCGAQILSYYRDRCGDDQCALHAYNVGPNTRFYADAGLRYVNKVNDHRAHMLSIVL
jgi:soluble lytic murein transglycosylase-like protein